MPGPSAAEKWDAAAEAIPQEKTIEVDGTPLGGAGEDAPVQVEDELAQRRALREATKAANRETATDLARIRTDARLRTADKVEEVSGGNIKHRPQFLENYPNSEEHKAGGMMSRRQANKGRGPIARFMEWLAQR